MPVDTPRLARASRIVLVVAWAPLLLYIPFDVLRGGGGNPIGLGLFAVAGTVVCGLLIVLQGVVRSVGSWSGRKDRAA